MLNPFNAQGRWCIETNKFDCIASQTAAEREGGRCVVFFSRGLVSSASGLAGAGLAWLLRLEAIHPFTDFTAYLRCITVGAGLREKIKASGMRIIAC